ncbi:hypothetical protein BC831DRAFT_439039, partial [Entophlyctis helioformis]
MFAYAMRFLYRQPQLYTTFGWAQFLLGLTRPVHASGQKVARYLQILDLGGPNTSPMSAPDIAVQHGFKSFGQVRLDLVIGAYPHFHLLSTTPDILMDLKSMYASTPNAHPARPSWDNPQQVRRTFESSQGLVAALLRRSQRRTGPASNHTEHPHMMLLQSLEHIWSRELDYTSLTDMMQVLGNGHGGSHTNSASTLSSINSYSLNFSMPSLPQPYAPVGRSTASTASTAAAPNTTQAASSAGLSTRQPAHSSPSATPLPHSPNFGSGMEGRRALQSIQQQILGMDVTPTPTSSDDLDQLSNMDDRPDGHHGPFAVSPAPPSGEGSIWPLSASTASSSASGSASSFSSANPRIARRRSIGPPHSVTTAVHLPSLPDANGSTISSTNHNLADSVAEFEPILEALAMDELQDMDTSLVLQQLADDAL